jgi:hypothetical protein
MNTKILWAVLGLATLTGCSTAYKSGRTPDDVYYSPARENTGYVAVEKNQDSYRNNQENYRNYENDYDYRDDRFFRLSMRNRMYRSVYDDFYWNDWRYGYTTSLYNPWNSYYSWNTIYNPYGFGYYPGAFGYYGGVGGYPYYPGVIGKPVYNTPASTYRPAFNGGGYKPANSNSPRYNFTQGSYTGNGAYNNSNRNTGSNRNSQNNNWYKTNNNTNNSNSNNDSYRSTTPSSTPNRSYTPSAPSTPPASSGSSGSSKPSRGGR